MRHFADGDFGREGFLRRARRESAVGNSLVGGASGIRTHEGLSSLPVFKFERKPSASVQIEQYHTIVNPLKLLSSAGMQALGGQGGGPLRA